ncbi:MAG: hypothetical protein ACKN9V_10140 [Pseudomonadota bacterium]
MITFLLVIVFFVSSAEASSPLYECSHPQGERLHVFLQGKATKAQRFSKVTKEEEEWKMPESVAFEDLPREPIRYLYGLPLKGKNIELKHQFELREQFFAEKKPQELQLMLIQGGGILRGWSCVTHGTQMDIKMLENYKDSSRADFLFLTRAVKGFLTEDKLSEESLGMLLQVVERYGVWSSQMDPTEFKPLLSSVFQPVRFLSPAMIKQVNERLSEAGRNTWEVLLKDLDYESFSAVQRWIFWVGLASRNNNEAVRAGVRGFVKSPLFQDENMRKFFETETRSAFKSLAEQRFKQIVDSGLSEKEKSYCKKLWAQRNG